MNSEDLLRAKRDVYVLVAKPGGTQPGDERFWSMRLRGLHEQNIKDSVNALREQRAARGERLAGNKTLKITELQSSVATALGAGPYEHWRVAERSKIEKFLASHGMWRPADLIRWQFTPVFSRPLSAQRLADRFFYSGRPLPKRLFTGVGSFLLAAKTVGRIDLDAVAGKFFLGDEERIEFCQAHATEILLREDLPPDNEGGTRKTLQLTGNTLLLNAMSEYVGVMYNLLGDNLMEPVQDGAPVLTLYNASDSDRAIYRRIFDIFRVEIQRTNAGWVEVLPLPGNDSIVFLRGADGAFDWVVKDQRDQPHSENPCFPMLRADELPSVMRKSPLAAHLYFSRGEWIELLEHQAEERHYAEGGTAANWPGTAKLIREEVRASRDFVSPRQVSARKVGAGFVPHVLADRRLMISPLVTIDQFWAFYQACNWRHVRVKRASEAGFNLEEDLEAVNLADERHLPASVTWFDAIAFCRHFEDETRLPVSLLDADTWRQISPPPLLDAAARKVLGEPRLIHGAQAVETYLSQRYWVSGGEPLQFAENLKWTENKQGLPFLAHVRFAEWLSDYHSGHAACACAATGAVLANHSLFGDMPAAYRSLSEQRCKSGFRLVYLSELDA